METKILCKRCGCDVFYPTECPPKPIDELTEMRTFQCSKCGELIEYACPIGYVPVFDMTTGCAQYHDTLGGITIDLPEPDVPDDYDDYDDVIPDPDDFYDDDGGFDPGIG